MLVHKPIVLLCLTALAGCRDDPPTCTDPGVTPTERPDIPLVRQTEHLDIHSQSFVCAGLAAELERHALFVAEQLDIELRSQIPIYLFEHLPEQCSTRVAGCVKEDGVVFSTARVIHHELNHSVACQLRIRPRAVLTEGTAVMFDPTSTMTPKPLDDHEGLIDFIDADGLPNYAKAGHVARWLFEREGSVAYAELYVNGGRRDDTFEFMEAVYGPLDELDTEYRDAPWQWKPFRQCADLPHVERDDDGVWRYSAFMDCDDEATLGPYVRFRDPHFTLGAEGWSLMYQSFTFTIDEEILLDYEMQGDILRVQLERCIDTHIDSSEDELAGGAKHIDPKSPTGYAIPHLQPGTWRADVLRDHGPPGPVAVAFWALDG